METKSQLSLRDWMSDADVSKWLTELGIPDAPQRRSGVKTSLHFFQTRMPLLKPLMALNFLLAIDLSRRVSEITLGIGDNIIAFRKRGEAEFKLFYTRPGASPHSSGIDPHDRVAVRYRVTSPAPALQSSTTGAIDVWSVPADHQRLTVAPRSASYGVMATGGGIQLIIPDAERCLTVMNAAK